ncbi:TetR/AcrR family transcriptional regulator [Kribbella sp. NPDC050124]|uniref:TetR/AcrR family transcriptional regulator n=1 Tax=Kribbella sp. NPDC050124 TaxID=3364114 RepID=UPI00378F39BF
MPDADDTKTRIYRAAVEMFYTHGYASASMRSIVQAADVRMSSVYYHYANKQELLYEVMRRSIEESTSLVLHSIEGATGPEARLRAALGAEIDWHTRRQHEAFIADAELFRLEEPYRAEIIALRDREESIFREIVDEGMRAGTFDLRDPNLVIRMLLTATTGVSRWYRADGPDTPAKIAASFADAVITGLRPRSSSTH